MNFVSWHFIKLQGEGAIVHLHNGVIKNLNERDIDFESGSAATLSLVSRLLPYCKKLFVQISYNDSL